MIASRVRKAAECYVSAGWAPIPLPPKSKSPNVEGWQNLRLTATDVKEAFGTNCNIGILLGEPSGGLVDADLDVFEATVVAPQLLPATGRISGRPGNSTSHYWYKTYAPPKKASTEFRDIDGTMLVELRSTGAQTVAPPSVHDIDGDVYEWERYDEPGEVKTSYLLECVQLVAAATLLARHWPSKGGRQDAALALAGGLWRAQWTADRIEIFLSAVVLAAKDDEPRMRLNVVERTGEKVRAGEPVYGWPRLAEIVGEPVVKRMRDWLGMPTESAEPLCTLKYSNKTTTQARLKAVEGFKPFPVASLPEPCATFVRQGARALGCDPVYLVLPVLSTVAAMIGMSRAIRLKRDWTEPCVVWTGIVGDSGTLKSPAQKLAVDPIMRMQRRLVQEHNDAIRVYKRQLAESKENNTEPPDKPVLRRLLTSDVTIEGLAAILQDAPKGLLLYRDELAGWLNSFNQYKSKGGSDLAGWLQLFRAETLVVDRKTGEPKHIYVPRAACSITGGIQPGVLARAMRGEFFEAGLAARLLFASPPKKPKQWTDDEIDPLVHEAYTELVERLANLEPDLDEEGDRVPFPVKLTSDARQLWIEFFNRWGRRQRDAEGELAAALSKLEGYSARFALIHHVVRHSNKDTCDPIEPISVQAGIDMATWFAYEVQRVYSMIGEDEEQREARKLIEFIQAHGNEMTARDLHKSNRSKYPATEDAEAALQKLVDAGIGTWDDSPTGGRPSRVFRLPTDSPYPESPNDAGDGGSPVDTPKRPPEPPASPNNSAGIHALGASGVCGKGSDPTATVNPEPASPPKPQEADSWAFGVNPNTRSGASESGIATYLSQDTPAPESPAFTYIQEQRDLVAVQSAVEESVVVGLDLETTGLRAAHGDRIRLMSLATARGTFLVDCFTVDCRPLFKVLAEKTIIGHNLSFELSFLGRLGFVPGKMRDLMLLSQLLTAGSLDGNSLKACFERCFTGKIMDKTEQTSDWQQPVLSQTQLVYAAKDVIYLEAMLQKMEALIAAAGLTRVDDLEHRCLPAVAWMSGHGVGFDTERWNQLALDAERLAEELADRLDKAAPVRPGYLANGIWNWNSPKQVKEIFSLVGVNLSSTADDALAAVDHNLARLLRDYREAKKKNTTYGRNWLQHVADDGRIYAGWRQIGSRSGRMACLSPNMQNLPRGEYRECIQAPEDRVLIKADYSQIELRIAAKVSGDDAMLKAYQEGADLHTLTAQRLLGKSEISKTDRQVAKSANFGLLYGMGAPGYRQYAKSNYGIDLTDQEAVDFRKAFFVAYPGLAKWHRRAGMQCKKTPTETRTLIGRRRLFVDKAPFTELLNSPVQGSGADGLKLALALLWERRDQAQGAVPVLAVHDEIVVECTREQAPAVGNWLKQAMIDAMAPLIEPVPIEVEVKFASTWGGT